MTQEWSKDVVVLFYGPKCPYSKYYLPTPPMNVWLFPTGLTQAVVVVREFLDVEMPKLLDMVSHVSSLIVAKIDCSGTFSKRRQVKVTSNQDPPAHQSMDAENECPMGVVSGYPTIALYKGCRSSEKKPASPLGYWLTREADDLYRFVRPLLCPLRLRSHVMGTHRWLKEHSYYSIPKKPVALPSSEPAANPAMAAAEQVGGELPDPLANAAGLLL